MRKLFLFFTTVILQFQLICAQAPQEVEVVDLGLSVYWASCNIGADSPEGYGTYFAWGETTGDPYQQGKTKDYNRSFDWQTYCGSETFQEWPTAPFRTDNHMLKAKFDAATANWGSDWRMPNGYEMDELVYQCNWTWTSDYNQSGVSGFVVSGTGDCNNNSIFLPAAGYRYLTGLEDLNSLGHYWSSSLDMNDHAFAWLGMFFHEGKTDGHRMENLYRNGGRSVRAVTSVKPTTGLEEREARNEKRKARKVLIDGDLRVERDGVQYNMFFMQCGR